MGELIILDRKKGEKLKTLILSDVCRVISNKLVTVDYAVWLCMTLRCPYNVFNVRENHSSVNKIQKASISASVSYCGLKIRPKLSNLELIKRRANILEIPTELENQINLLVKKPNNVVEDLTHLQILEDVVCVFDCE